MFPDWIGPMVSRKCVLKGTSKKVWSMRKSWRIYMGGERDAQRLRENKSYYKYLESK